MPSSSQVSADQQPPAEHSGYELASVDRTLRLVHVDAALAARLGLPAAVLCEQPLADALPAWGTTLEPALRRVLATGLPVLDLALGGDAQHRDHADLYPVLSRGEAVLGVDLVFHHALEAGPGPDPAHAAAHERARLYEAERRARQRAEGLQAVATALSGASTPAEVYAVLLRHGFTALVETATAEQGEIRASTLFALTDDALDLVGWTGIEPALIDRYRHIPLVTAIPICDVARTASAIWIHSRADYARRYPHLEDQIRLLQTEAAASLPLVFEGRVLGVLTITFVHERTFEPDERAFLLTLATQAAQALERSRLFASLQESEATLSAVLDALPVGVVIADAQGKLIRTNEAHNTLWGLAPETTSWEEYGAWVGYWPATGARIQGHEWAIARALLLGEVVTSELVECQPFGSDERRLYLNNAAPVRDAQGAIIAGVVVELDMTEVRHAERAILRRSAQLQHLAEVGVRINGVHDVGAVLEIVTAEARALLGACWACAGVIPDEPEHTALTFTSYLGEAARWQTEDAGWASAVFAALAGHLSRPLRLDRAELETHPLWELIQGQAGVQTPLCSWMAAPLTGRDGQALGLIQLADKGEGAFGADDEAILVQLAQLTAVALENRQLFAYERQARAEAEAAVRVRDGFLSVAAHELQTPLAALLGTIQLMQQRDAREGMLAERERRSLTTLATQGRRIQRLIANLLDVTRLSAGRMTIEAGAVVDMRALVARLAEELRTTTTRHRLDLSLAPEPLVLRGDALRIEQVVANLVQNALKYSPHGGVVTVALERRAAEAVLTVSDQGIGIPAEALPQLFTPYYRAPNTAAAHIAGLGIGLFVVKEIVERHGGSIAVTSVEGQGSTFVVRLPLVPGPSAV